MKTYYVSASIGGPSPEPRKAGDPGTVQWLMEQLKDKDPSAVVLIPYPGEVDYYQDPWDIVHTVFVGYKGQVILEG